MTTVSNDEIVITKYHALGNDYLFLDATKYERPSLEMVKKICHRNFGIGSDGILYGAKMDDFSAWLEIFNPDGSIAEISGNGTRIFARAMIDNHQFEICETFKITTAKKSVTATAISNNRIEVNMGKPKFRDDNIPYFPSQQGECVIDGKSFVYHPVSMGNPHCVIFVESPSAAAAKILGPIFENLPEFPQKTNVQFARIIDKNNIVIEIWERGAGYTLASGSSACAVFAISRSLGKCSDNITMHMPGGDLSLFMVDNGDIIQTGTVEKIATCFVDVDYFARM